MPHQLSCKPRTLLGQTLSLVLSYMKYVIRITTDGKLTPVTRSPAASQCAVLCRSVALYLTQGMESHFSPALGHFEDKPRELPPGAVHPVVVGELR